MLSEYGDHSRVLKINRLFLQIKSGRILDLLWAFLIKQFFPLALVGYAMIIATYHLISNALSWNNC